jgi:AmiR/NasT family two-component response regulator
MTQTLARPGAVAAPAPVFTPHHPPVVPATTRSLRIIVADGDPKTCLAGRELLTGLGHEVCGAGTGAQLVALCRQLRPDLVIVAARLPDQAGVVAAREACRERPIPVILMTDGNIPDPATDDLGDPVLAYLTKPVTAAQLAPGIVLAVRHFDEAQVLRQQVADLTRQLEERKVIERAKGVIVRRIGLDEAEAFARMRKLASDRNLKLIDVARSILTAEEVFGELEECREPCRKSAPMNGRVRS